MNAEELGLYTVSDGMVHFRSEKDFEVDGIVYGRYAATNCVQRMFDVKINECACVRMPDRINPGECGFDFGGDMNNLREGEALGDAYRWSPGMMYYRSRKVEPYRKGVR